MDETSPTTSTAEESDTVRRSLLTIRDDSRGVWWTVSAIFAVLLVFAAIGMVADMQPATSQERADQLIEYQLSQTAADILETSSARGDLKESALYWNPTAERFHDASSDEPSEVYYTTLPSDHPLADVISTAQEAGSFAFNLEVQYRTRSGDSLATQRVVYQGPPGKHAVAQSAKIVLSEDDQLVRADGTRGCSLEELDSGSCSGSYFAPNALSGDTYNIVNIRLVLWKQ